MYALGDAMDVVAGDDLSDAYAADPQLAQLHQLALLIVALRQQFNSVLSQIANATNTTVDPTDLAIISQQISQYVDAFRSFRATIDRSTVNANALNAVDQSLLDIGTWAAATAQFVASIPKTVLDTSTGAVQAVLDALGKVAQTAGKDVGMALVWPAVIVLGAIALAGRAEKTRTYKKLVA